jgi:DNA repair photolyase
VLIGIAKLAQAGETLAQKSAVAYRTLPTRSLLNRCSGERVPFQWTVNPYRGCEFGCKYCYARYTHEFMELREPLDFERRIFAKEFDARAFSRELRAVKAEDWIAIGTATDPYQPAERRYCLTQKVLEVFLRREGFQLAITTKSDLVARDAELLAAVSVRNRVRVNITVTTLDTALARLLEPLAPRPDLRLGAMSVLARAGVEVGVAASPVMPGINDGAASLEAIARAASAAGAGHMWAQAVFLKPCALAVFLPFLEDRFPRLALAYRSHFARHSHIRGEYDERLRTTLTALQIKYGLKRPPAMPWGQMKLEAEWDPSEPPEIQAT